jgi:alpha-tubulin suppressor-like RCC1 family protein
MRVSLPAPVSDVAAGWTHACVLTPEKKALCWGRNGYYASEIPAPPTVVFRERSFRTLAAGNHSACGVEVGGDLVCWKGTLTPESFFTAKGLAVSRLTLSSLHACALTADGVAYCWGNGREGQLGDGTARDQAAPVRVAGTLTFRSLATGTYHTCGITLDGEAYCWGWDNFSGVSPLSPSSAPVRIAGDLRFTSVASGFQFSCGISDEGYAYCWGRNEQGELGNPNAGRSSASPVRVGGALRFASLAAGGNNACGITTAGQLFCWGSDVMGQLGIGSTPDPETWRQFKGAPTRVPNPLP